ncbi:MAG: queuosine precursor transporter [Legionellaceae bacterium]|nr:queuosine precursor transporter [Legionellaceae bacterium]
MKSLEATPNYKDEFQSKYFPFILVLFSSTWLISTISAIKIVSFVGITLTGGFILFPVTSILSILIADVYGYKGSRQAIWCGTMVNLTYVFFINLINQVPPSPSWTLANEFHAILIPQTRLIFASVIGFWVSGFINSYSMSKLKIRGLDLASRILISSVISITIDILLYFSIGLLGTIPFAVFKQLLLFAYSKKLICELLFLPIIWKLIDVFKKIEGFEIYDMNTNFTPFSIDNVYKINDYRKIQINKKKSSLTQERIIEDR